MSPFHPRRLGSDVRPLPGAPQLFPSSALAPHGDTGDIGWLVADWLDPRCLSLTVHNFGNQRLLITVLDLFVLARFASDVCTDPKGQKNVTCYISSSPDCLRQGSSVQVIPWKVFSAGVGEGVGEADATLGVQPLVRP